MFPWAVSLEYGSHRVTVSHTFHLEFLHLVERWTVVANSTYQESTCVLCALYSSRSSAFPHVSPLQCPTSRSRRPTSSPHAITLQNSSVAGIAFRYPPVSYLLSDSARSLQRSQPCVLTDPYCDRRSKCTTFLMRPFVRS